eukprot:3714822-Rhodomonas_salina.1
MADRRVIAHLTSHKAHITVPQDSQFFYQGTTETEGVHVVRVDEEAEEGCLRCTVVEGPWTELGKE